MLISGTMPPSAVKLSCMALTAPQEAAVVTTANSAEGGDAEADLLALHVAAVEAERMQDRIAGGFRPVGDRDAGEEQNAHCGEDRPALALVADHAAEQIGERRADAKIDSISMKLVERVGFSNGWAALALKKPPPLVPSILMATCEATGPTAMVCLRALEVVAAT